MTDRSIRFLPSGPGCPVPQATEIALRLPWSVKRYEGTVSYRGRPQVGIADCDGLPLFVVFSFKSMEEMEVLAAEVCRVMNESSAPVDCAACRATGAADYETEDKL